MTSLPNDFSDALQESGLAETFSASAGSHQREYLKWIAEARQPATRKARIEKTLKMIAAKSAEKTARLRKKP